jgi:iron(III) transport system permease protein
VSARLLDLLLLTAVALPGIVFAAGYIFTYNQPVLSHIGLRLYGTTALLILGYVATALPATSRVLVGTVSQVQDSLSEAGRVHGSSAMGAWLRTVLPVLARPLITAWLLCFGATLFELPVSELLLAPGHEPLSVAITHVLQGYWFSQGTAMEVISVLVALAVVSLAWGLFRLFAPHGWQRVGRLSA